MAEVESMNEGTQFGGVEGTYIEAIDGPREGAESTESAAPEGETVEATEQSSDATEQTEATELPSYLKDPLVNELIGKFAKDHPELDPANPAHLKILNRMAHQEKMIRGLKSKPAQTDHLTDFERSVLNPKDEAAPAGQQTQTATETTRTAPTGEGIAAAWKGPKDALADLTKAWTREGGPDLDTVNEIEVNLFQKRASALGYMNAEQAQALVERTIQERLGDVLPNIRETVEMQQSQAAKEFALAELAKNPGWEHVADLETEIDGEPLMYAGKPHPNTALNRIIIDNPEILDISVTRNAKGQLLSRQDSETLTFMARFRAAGRIAKQGQMENGKVKQILEAGAKQAERTNGDRVRQGLNGGKGATGLPNGKKTGSLVHELVNDGGPRSFSSV